MHRALFVYYFVLVIVGPVAQIDGVRNAFSELKYFWVKSVQTFLSPRWLVGYVYIYIYIYGVSEGGPWVLEYPID